MSPLVLDKEQHKVLTEAYHEASNFGASPREKKALTEALIVESNIRNLTHGDRDSVGALQQRPGSGWHHAMNVKLAVRDFLTHARAKKGMPGSAGQLAQAVQISGHPERYAAQGDVANSLLQRYDGGSSKGGGGDAYSLSSPGTTQTRVVSQTVDDPEAQKRVAFAQYLQSADPGSMLLKLGVVDPTEPVTKTVQRNVVTHTPGGAVSTERMLSHPGHTKGVAQFGDKKVAAWIKPVLEYARSKGWEGQINSGYRSYAEQQRIYNSGVRPAAKPGTSNHEFTAFPGGAIDVSDAETLSHILRGSKYAKLLVWAGSKDPVHFSHPHGGSY